MEVGGDAILNDQLVSVIITTYKREKAMLGRAIDSVLNQTYKNHELIVVDDNDDINISNNVKKLIEEKNEREHKDIKLVCYGKNMGLPYARNAGLKIAKGEFIAFLDDDDQWLDRKLELQINKFNQCSEGTGIVYCSAIVEKDNETKIRKAQYRGDINDKLIYGNLIGSPSFSLIKRECFDFAGGFDEDKRLKAKEDHDLWLRICKRYKVDYVDQPLAIYDAHSGDKMSLRYGNFLEAELYFFEKHKEEFIHFPDSFSHRLAVIGEYYYRLHDLDNARRYYKMAIKAYSRNWKAYRLLLRSYVFRNSDKYYPLKSKIAKLLKKIFASFKDRKTASKSLAASKTENE